MAEQLGDRIRAARERRGLTQEELADEIGVSRETVGNWETGQSTPRNKLGALRAFFADQLDGTVSPDSDDGGVLLKLDPETYEAYQDMDPISRQRAQREAEAALLRVMEEARRRADDGA